MIDNRWAAGIGAGVGLIPALLINRYALGNTSGKSALLAALIGGGLGAAGVGLNNYLKGRALAAQQASIHRYNKQRDLGTAELAALAAEGTDLDSAETRQAVRGSLAKVYGLAPDEIPDAAIDATLNQIEADRFTKSIMSDPDKILNIGTNTALVPMDAQILQSLDQIANNRFKAPGARSQSQERVHGGYLADNQGKQGEEVFQQMLNSELGLRAAGGDRNKLAALINYHNKVYQVASSDLIKKLPVEIQGPEIVDYIALRAMPEEQRRLVPVVHRLSAAARAKATKGWSYSYDFQTMTNPTYFKESSRIPNMQEQLVDLSVAATSPAAAAALPVFVGSLADAGISNHFQKSLPVWDPSRDSKLGDTWSTRYYRNEVIKKLTDPSSGIPIYSWQAPELARQMTHKGVTNLASSGIDAAFDVKRMLTSPKMHGIIIGNAVKYGKKHNKLRGLRKFKYWADKSGVSSFLDPVNYLSGGMNALSGYVGFNDIQQGKLLRDRAVADNLQHSAVADSMGNNAFSNAIEAQIQYLINRKRR